MKLFLCTALKAVQPQFEYGNFPLKVFVDSLPIVLCNIASKFNRKIARYKLFLDSLNWCEIVWCPGKSPIIAMADYISRTSEDIATKQRLPTLWDEKLCNEINSKLDRSVGYSVPLTVFLIEELICLSPEELGLVKDK